MSRTDDAASGEEGQTVDERRDIPAEDQTPDPLPVRRSPGDVAVTQEQLERVIRRASDLQFRSSTSVGGTLQPNDVVQIGAEVGLDERHVRQALAEVQAASLIPSPPEDDGFVRKFIGSAIVRASRVVPGDQGHVERNLDVYLKEKELLKQVRSRPGRSLWEPAAGLVSQMRRAMDVGGHGYMLAKARSVQVAIEPLESGWSLVTITADIGNIRGEHAGGFVFGFGFGGIAAGVGLAVATGGGILPILGAVAVASGAVGAATWGARASVRKQHERMELALQGLLDRLERGESLHEEAEPWHRKLLG
ncbi:MAG: hypothetical protein MJB57_08025 [Gemmatimonadetes bacterium]|nr:hypothetical protein [Gemmatimonadota bacterium]